MARPPIGICAAAAIALPADVKGWRTRPRLARAPDPAARWLRTAFERRIEYFVALVQFVRADVSHGRYHAGRSGYARMVAYPVRHPAHFHSWHHLATPETGE